MGKVKAHELRPKTKGELVKTLEELKADLAKLRVQQTTGGNAAKVARIGVVRKAIARVLTVTNQKAKKNLRESFTAQCDKKAGMKMPVDLREKKTRAIRRRLTPAQAAKKTVKQQKKDWYYPQRVFAIKAV